MSQEETVKVTELVKDKCIKTDSAKSKKLDKNVIEQYDSDKDRGRKLFFLNKNSKSKHYSVRPMPTFFMCKTVSF